MDISNLIKTYVSKNTYREAGEDYLKQTLIYDRGHNGYFLKTSAKLLEVKIATKEEYYDIIAGNINHVFPQYNPEKHYFDFPVYNNTSELLCASSIPVQLFEYEEDNNKIYGCFLVENTNRGILLRRISFSQDEYIDLSGKFDLIKDFKDFRQNKQKYKNRGQRARKGVLCYGPPGNGKTAQIAQLAKPAEEEKFRLFFIDRNVSLRDLVSFKKLFESEDSVFVIEELTERTDGRNAEELLSFLDGELSWDNCYIIATTNNPEELPWNIIDRPSRFKLKIEFSNPTKSERELYLRHMKVSESSIQETLDLTENMSLDYVKNIVLDSFLEEKSIPAIIKESKEIRSKIQNKFKATKLGL